MPILATLVAGLFGSLAEFFSIWVTKKIAVGAAVVSVFAALTVALMAGMTALINGIISVGVLPDGIIFGIWYFMPSSFPAIFSAVVSAHIAAALYQWNRMNLVLMATI